MFEQRNPMLVLLKEINSSRDGCVFILFTLVLFKKGLKLEMVLHTFPPKIGSLHDRWIYKLSVTESI